MKLIIDIPERDYDLACKYPNALIATYAHYIKDGIPYEERPQGELSNELSDEQIEKITDLLETEWGYEGIREDVSRILRRRQRMKLIIDIPNYNNLNDIQNGSIACSQVLRAVKNGIPYEERPQGEWIFIDNEVGWDVCSNCNWTDARCHTWRYCPNCGADMREGRE